MTTQLELLDHATRDDLRTYLERLQHAGQPEVRLVRHGDSVAVYGCTQAPVGLTDPVPVVLVVRAFALAGSGAPSAGGLSAEAPSASADRESSREDLDVTVSARAVLDRIARMGPLGRHLDIPDVRVTVAWAGVLPPLTGWEAMAVLDAGSLATVAAEGIARVAETLPENPGDAVVRRVRSAVWGAEVAPHVPAAAAFAGEALGFLRGETAVRVARTLTWIRLSTRNGYVLVRNFPG